MQQYEMQYEDYEVKFKGWDNIYDETFLSYFNLLYTRMKRLDDLGKDSLDYRTYTDMCINDKLRM